MARADTCIIGTLISTQYSINSLKPVYTTYGIFLFFVDRNGDVSYVKSTDGGLSWGTPVTVSGNVSAQALSVWYDRWSGIDDDTIHAAYIDSTSHDVLYCSLEADTESAGSPVQVFDGASVGAVANSCVAVTIARGGNILVAFDIDGGTEKGFYRSTDAGASFGSRAESIEGADYFLLAPGFAADNQDIIMIFWDRSADEISRKLYDDSGDSWAETSIAASMADGALSTAQPHFAITTDLANSKVLLVAWSAVDTANADLRYWTIDESAITESSTNVVLNSTDDQGMCGVVRDTVTGRVFVFYGGKSDGSETFTTSLNVYYKYTTDGGATWSAETALSNFASDISFLMTSMHCTDGLHDAVIVWGRESGAVGHFAISYDNHNSAGASSGSGSAPTAAQIADAVWDELQADHVGAGTFGVTASEIADILVDTAEIGAAGAGLTNINLPNQTMDIVGNITGNLSGSVGSVTGAVGSVTGNVGGNVTGSVGSVATGGIVAASFGTGAIDAAALAADAGTEIGTAVWASAARTLTALDEDSTTLDLDATIRAAVGLASANLDTQIGTLATAANLATVAGYLDTEIAAILADTNELQVDWVNGGRLDLLIDAIKAKTDSLPSDPADESSIQAAIAALSIPSAATIASAVIASTIDGAHDLGDVLRIIVATTAGASDISGNSHTFYALDGVTTRVVCTANSEGDRSAFTYTP